MAINYFNRLKSGEDIFFFQIKYSFFKPEKSEVKKNFLKKLYGSFLWMGFNCLKARATSKKQFTF